MSGVKGRSGRRKIKDEEKRQRIIDKAWDLVEIKLDSNDIDRFQLARDIVVKDVPSELKGKGFGGERRVIIIRPAGSIGDIGGRVSDPIVAKAG